MSSPGLRLLEPAGGPWTRTGARHHCPARRRFGRSSRAAGWTSSFATPIAARGCPARSTSGPSRRSMRSSRGWKPPPEFNIVFPGDEVIGLTADEAVLRAQWRHWHEREMAWARSRGRADYHAATGNHTTYDALSEAVFREALPHLPRNGPPGQEGLSYFVRRGDLLLVVVDTCWSGFGLEGQVEFDWLDRTLAAHAGALQAGGRAPPCSPGQRLRWCLSAGTRPRAGGGLSRGCWRATVSWPTLTTSSRSTCRFTMASCNS